MPFKNEIIDLYKSGETLMSLSRLYDISYRSLRDMLIGSGVDLRNPGRRKINDGLTYSQRSRAKEDKVRYGKRIESNYFYNIKKKFGLSKNDVLAMLEAQFFKCAICQIHHDDHGKRFALDHCHSSGKVRALSCSKCNILIGLAGDRLDILDSAKAYLAIHKQ